jgi:hypothetical protein
VNGVQPLARLLLFLTDDGHVNWWSIFFLINSSTSRWCLLIGFTDGNIMAAWCQIHSVVVRSTQWHLDLVDA